VSRAVQIHQHLLQRPRLGRLEHTHVLLCLGLDYRRGGFIDRAIEAFQEVLRLDPTNEHALAQLEKLYEDQHNWTEAARIRERLTETVAPGRQPRHRTIRAFLENQIGVPAPGPGQPGAAAPPFAAAIEIDPAVTPAYVNLGDLRLAKADTAGAIAMWETLTATSPRPAHLVLERRRSAPAPSTPSHRSGGPASPSPPTSAPAATRAAPSRC